MGIYKKKRIPTKHVRMGIHFFILVDPRGVEPLTSRVRFYFIEFQVVSHVSKIPGMPM